MRAALSAAGYRVRGGADAREPPTKIGAPARVLCRQHFREELCFLARILGVRLDLTWALARFATRRGPQVPLSSNKAPFNAPDMHSCAL